MEPVNQLVEQRSGAAWVAIGLGSAALLTGSTFFLVGVGDVLAGSGAVLVGLAGLGAAGWRRRLAALPLELAPRAVRHESPLGSDVTVRGWLGRGRRIEQLTVTVLADGKPTDVLLFRGPLVGPFQVLVSGAPERLEVTVEAREGAQTHRITQVYPPDTIEDGRFDAPVTRRGKRLRWTPERWSSLRS